jgi:hypothetical protein
VKQSKKEELIKFDCGLPIADCRLPIAECGGAAGDAPLLQEW